MEKKNKEKQTKEVNGKIKLNDEEMDKVSGGYFKEIKECDEQNGK